ncbi:MAG: hypothetical protein RLZZ50_2053, partial [Verrucomicrobiota bacterium]
GFVAGENEDELAVNADDVLPRFVGEFVKVASKLAGAVLGGDAKIKHPRQHAFEGAGMPTEALAGAFVSVGGGDEMKHAPTLPEGVGQARG